MVLVVTLSTHARLWPLRVYSLGVTRLALSLETRHRLILVWSSKYIHFSFSKIDLVYQRKNSSIY